jgi:hypothetical protein
MRLFHFVEELGQNSGPYFRFRRRNFALMIIGLIITRRYDSRGFGERRYEALRLPLKTEAAASTVAFRPLTAANRSTRTFIERSPGQAAAFDPLQTWAGFVDRRTSSPGRPTPKMSVASMTVISVFGPRQS